MSLETEVKRVFLIGQKKVGGFSGTTIARIGRSEKKSGLRRLASWLAGQAAWPAQLASLVLPAVQLAGRPVGQLAWRLASSSYRFRFTAALVHNGSGSQRFRLKRFLRNTIRGGYSNAPRIPAGRDHFRSSLRR